MEFDPSMPFFELYSVRYLLKWIFLTAFIAFMALLTWAIRNLDLDWSAAGVNYFFFTVLRLPIAILAVLIPSVAIMAANHRSVQSKETMRLTREQNNFTNYYKHLEEFEKYMELAPFNDLMNIDTRRLHNRLFPQALSAGVQLDESLIDRVATFGASLAGAMANLHRGDLGIAFYNDKPRIKHGVIYTNLDEVISALVDAVGPEISIKPNFPSRLRWFASVESLKKILSTHQNQLEQAYLSLSTFKHAVSFDAQYASPLLALLAPFEKIVAVDVPPEAAAV